MNICVYIYLYVSPFSISPPCSPPTFASLLLFSNLSKEVTTAPSSISIHTLFLSTFSPTLPHHTTNLFTKVILLTTLYTYLVLFYLISQQHLMLLTSSNTFSHWILKLPTFRCHLSPPLHCKWLTFCPHQSSLQSRLCFSLYVSFLWAHLCSVALIINYVIPKSLPLNQYIELLIGHHHL